MPVMQWGSFAQAKCLKCFSPLGQDKLSVLIVRVMIARTGLFAYPKRRGIKSPVGRQTEDDVFCLAVLPDGAIHKGRDRLP